jgi:hypothetical protein
MTTGKLVREPLLHFLALGAGLFLLQAWRGGSAAAQGSARDADATRIVVTRDDVAKLTAQFERTWQRPPTEAERAALVEDHVRNEVAYREALAMGLDRDDDVIRRRMRMKLEFVLEDVRSLAEPTDDDLRAYLEANRARYVTEPEVSFRQVYFNADRRDADAETRARAALARLAEGADPDKVGDPTLLAAETPLAPLSRIRDDFGDEFARGLRELEPGRWSGPVRSGYGLHLVVVRERREPRLPGVAEIRDALARDWIGEKQRELKDAAYARLRERYTVRVDAAPGDAAPRPGGDEPR